MGRVAGWEVAFLAVAERDRGRLLPTLTTGGSDDGSIQPGRQMWFYQLLRQVDGRWLISGGGSGP
jgi:hypothetical protein